MGKTLVKQRRHAMLEQKLKDNPFLRDEDLARELGVSVATIRFDRAELGIKEYRERIKNVAKSSMLETENRQEVLDIHVLHDGIAMLQTDASMAFAGTTLIKGHEIFAFAEKLAADVIGAKGVLVKVANMKYIKEVYAGDKLVARSEVKRIRDSEYLVWVKITRKMAEVFRVKFNLAVPKEF